MTIKEKFFKFSTLHRPGVAPGIFTQKIQNYKIKNFFNSYKICAAKLFFFSNLTKRIIYQQYVSISMTLKVPFQFSNIHGISIYRNLNNASQMKTILPSSH